MKIMFLSYMDFLGAGNAAKKIFLMLKEKGVDVDFFVKKKKSSFSQRIKLKFDQKIHDKIFDLLNYGSNKFLNNRISLKYNPYYKSCLSIAPQSILSIISYKNHSLQYIHYFCEYKSNLSMDHKRYSFLLQSYFAVHPSFV